MPKKKIQDEDLLFLIKEYDKTQRELAEYFNVTEAAISQKLRRWQKNGIIKKDQAATEDQRRLRCAKTNIWMLTAKGKLLYERTKHSQPDPASGGDGHPLAPEGTKHEVNTAQASMDAFNPDVENVPRRVHGLCYYVPIRGERPPVPDELNDRTYGMYPPHLKKTEMAGGWIKVHGDFMGAYIVFTTKNIMFWLRGDGPEFPDCHRNAEERAREIWIKLRHTYGWDIPAWIGRKNHTLDEEYQPIEMVEGQEHPDQRGPYEPGRLPKYSIRLPGAEKLRSPQVTSVGEVEDTPWPHTIHGNPADLNDLVDTSRYIQSGRYHRDLERFRVAVEERAKERAKAELMRDLADAAEGNGDGAAGDGADTAADAADEGDDEETRYHG